MTAFFVCSWATVKWFGQKAKQMAKQCKDEVNIFGLTVFLVYLAIGAASGPRDFSIVSRWMTEACTVLIALYSLHNFLWHWVDSSSKIHSANLGATSGSDSEWSNRTRSGDQCVSTCTFLGGQWARIWADSRGRQGVQSLVICQSPRKTWENNLSGFNPGKTGNSLGR